MSQEEQPTEQLVGISLVGANRGGQHHLMAVSSLVGEFPGARAAVRVIDPLPPRAQALAERVTAEGGIGVALQARLEEALPVLAESTEPLVLAVDTPRTIATALLAPETQERWVFPYALLRPPSGELLSLRGVIPPGDASWRTSTAALIMALDSAVSGRGAEYAIGSQAPSAARVREPQHRASMAEHLKRNLRKLLAGLAPESAPLTLSIDGVSEMPLLVMASETWQEPRALALRTRAAPPVPLTRNAELALAETTPDGIRIHRFRVRTNGQLMVRGRHALDTESLRLALARAEEERLARATLNRSNALDITD